MTSPIVSELNLYNAPKSTETLKPKYKREENFYKNDLTNQINPPQYQSPQNHIYPKIQNLRILESNHHTKKVGRPQEKSLTVRINPL